MYEDRNKDFTYLLKGNRWPYYLLILRQSGTFCDLLCELWWWYDQRRELVLCCKELKPKFPYDRSWNCMLISSIIDAFCASHNQCICLPAKFTSYTFKSFSWCCWGSSVIGDMMLLEYYFYIYSYQIQISFDLDHCEHWISFVLLWKTWPCIEHWYDPGNIWFVWWIAPSYNRSVAIQWPNWNFLSVIGWINQEMTAISVLDVVCWMEFGNWEMSPPPSLCSVEILSFGFAADLTILFL